jgi:glycosyltransferase involved in cell wall biosynthesis
MAETDNSHGRRTILFAAWAPFFSGAERALLLTIRGLERNRYRPYVLVGTEGELIQQLREAGVPCSVIDFRTTDKRHPLAFAKSVWRIVRIARAQKAAILHANEVPIFQPCGYAARLLGIPAICHVRFPEGASGFEWFLKPGFTRALFVSDYLRRYGETEAPQVFAGRSETVYDGVAMPATLDDDQRQSLRKELGLYTGHPTVGLAGQVAEVKGIWDFIEAARLLIAKGVTATFVVVGDDLKGRGRLRREMERRVQELGLDSWFRFTGFRTDASTLVQLFDVVAVPSHIEPLGNATLEAMAAGRPVVGSRVGGIPEMVVEGETGLLVPPKQPDQLAAALERLLASPELGQKFGAAGRERARTAFSIDRHAAQIQAIYDSLVAG